MHIAPWLALGVILAGCGLVQPCVPIAPRVFPNGGAPGTPALVSESGATAASWGAGDNLVVQRFGPISAASDPPCGPGEIAGPGGCHPRGPLEVRGVPAVLLTVGDQAETGWVLGWASGGCRYEVTFGPMTREEAEAYAAGY